MTGLKVSTAITLIGMMVGGAVGGVVYVEKGDSETKKELKTYTTEEINKLDRFNQEQIVTMKDKIEDIDDRTQKIYELILQSN